MEVTFERTGARRYGVSVTRAPYPPVAMHPAPSYDEDLPHDFVHFVVEQELGLKRGVFGQLAAGGDAGTFQLVQDGTDAREMARARKKQRQQGRRQAEEGVAEAEFSERAATICHQEWFRRFPTERRLKEVAKLEAFVHKVRAACSPAELASLAEPVVTRICHRLEQLSQRWAEIEVGDAITLRWDGVGSGSARRRA